MSTSLDAVNATEDQLNAQDQQLTHPRAQNQPHRSWSDHIVTVRKALDLEISAVTVQLCSLRTRYNDVAHVNRLPSEILAHIFGYLQDLDKPRYNLGWLQVTHVCHQWRTAALDHASLWSDILCDFGPRWAEKFLHRSRMAPISFVYPTVRIAHGRTEIDVVDVLTQHLCHMQELDITVSGKKHEDTAPIISTLQRPAPLLEEAFIYNTGTFTPTLPRDIFAHSAPQLRLLNIWSFNVEWSSLTFDNLVQLHVGAHSTISGPEGFEQFLAALARMPALEVLELRYAVSGLLGSVSPHSYAGLTTFPKLHKFTLKDNVAACATALKHMAIAPTMVVDVECLSDSTDERSSNHIIPWLTSYIGVHQITSTIDVAFRPRGFEIYISEGFVASVGQPAGDRSFRLCVKYIAREEVVDELSAVFQVLPGLERLEALSITAQGVGPGTQDWFFTFGKCYNLHKLEIQLPLENGDSLWTALGQVFPNSLDGDHTELLFPSLAFLTLRGDGSGHEINTVDGKLTGWIKHRKSFAPLQTIEVLECRRHFSLVCELRTLVPKLIWNGKQISGQP
ncbi:hypothetical protein DENSPDRAFT_454542 [Dentipellis sp. KUC8613]|nr:hypothetical protein DENSPDRAFT_454542 [Dentipellis sp. KUC8613]